MTDKKLTPRVGDRVLVKKGWGYQTMVGSIVERVSHDNAQPTVRHDTDHFWSVDIDGYGVTLVHPEYVNVVDRVPVEWPEGWEYAGTFEVEHRRTNVVLEREGLAEILRTGPDMLARWDELMGGDE